MQASRRVVATPATVVPARHEALAQTFMRVVVGACSLGAFAGIVAWLRPLGATHTYLHTT